MKRKLCRNILVKMCDYLKFEKENYKVKCYLVIGKRVKFK